MNFNHTLNIDLVLTGDMEPASSTFRSECENASLLSVNLIADAYFPYEAFRAVHHHTNKRKNMYASLLNEKESASEQ